MKIYFSIILTVLCFGLHAQNKPTTTYQRLFEKVNMNLLKGKWQNIDSSKNIYEFHFDKGTVYLGSEEQFSSYHFSRKDSVNVSAVGFLMRWPPAYCYIMEISEDSLKLEFSGVANKNPVVYFFKKIRSH